MTGTAPAARVGGSPADRSLHHVLAAFRAGAGTTEQLARATGLDRGLVEVALEQLVSLGLVTRSTVSSACPEGGCGGCPAPTGHGCGTPTRGRLVTLTLGRRPV